MTFDIIPITDEEVARLHILQLKLLRTAQQKKNALYHEMQQKLKEYKLILISNGMKDSSLYAAMETELTEEYEYQVEIIREQLIFSMTLKDPTNDGELGGGDGETENTGYVVDYSLSYLERYIAVRDYYMSIEDPHERLALYARDEVAMRYLDSYYNGLFDYLNSFT